MDSRGIDNDTLSIIFQYIWSRLNTFYVAETVHRITVKTKVEILLCSCFSKLLRLSKGIYGKGCEKRKPYLKTN